MATFYDTIANWNHVIGEGQFKAEIFYYTSRDGSNGSTELFVGLSFEDDRLNPPGGTFWRVSDIFISSSDPWEGCQRAIDEGTEFYNFLMGLFNN